jgi:hypothetical protein
LGALLRTAAPKNALRNALGFRRKPSDQFVSRAVDRGPVLDDAAHQSLDQHLLCRPEIDADKRTRDRKRIDGRVDVICPAGCGIECDGKRKNGDEQPGPAGMTERRTAERREPTRP